MLSLKRKISKDQAPATPAWHPNFRNFELLPDTKVVRTAFFVNTVALVAAGALLLYVAYREYQVHSLRGQVAAWQERIDANTRQSSGSIALNRKFSDEEKKILELEKFLTDSFDGSDFLVAVAQSLPAKVSLVSVDYREVGATLRGLLEGAPEEASGTASAYLEVLRQEPRLGSYFGEISLTNLTRDAATGQLAFEILLKPKVAEKEKK